MQVQRTKPRYQGGVRVVMTVLLLGLSVSGSPGPGAQAATTIRITTTTDEVNHNGECAHRSTQHPTNLDTAVDHCSAGTKAATSTVPADTASDVIDPSASAASPNLVWKPYLQQLTDTGVVIRWTTTTGSSSLVHYSTDTSYSSSASDSARTIAALGTQMHRVALSGLQPDTTYFYKVYTDNENLWPEQTLSFRTAPRRGSSTPFTFAAFGDFGKNTDSQKRLRDQLARDSFRFLVTTGDNAYDAGRYSEFDSKVFQLYGTVFSKAAVFPTLGNHDYASSSGSFTL